MRNRLWDYEIQLAFQAWSLHAKILYPVINVIISGLPALVRLAADFAGVLALLDFGIYKDVKFYQHYFTDLLSLLAALVSLAILVWFADVSIRRRGISSEILFCTIMN